LIYIYIFIKYTNHFITIIIIIIIIIHIVRQYKELIEKAIHVENILKYKDNPNRLGIKI